MNDKKLNDNLSEIDNLLNERKETSTNNNEETISTLVDYVYMSGYLTGQRDLTELIIKDKELKDEDYRQEVDKLKHRLLNRQSELLNGFDDFIKKANEAPVPFVVKPTENTKNKNTENK